MNPPFPETTRTEKPERGRVADLNKLIDEIKLLRSRAYNMELSRLVEGHQKELENIGKDGRQRPKGVAPEELMRLQSEERRVREAEHERTKEMLVSKYQKLDAGLLLLTQFLKEVGPLKELEMRLATLEEKLKKEQDELNVQRKVMGREQEEFDHDKELIRTSQLALKAKQKELDERAANLDVARRAKELDAQKKELEQKLGAYNAETATLNKMRDEFYRDMDQLGEKRAQLDRDVEALSKEREAIRTERVSMGDLAAKEMALTLEAFLRDMFKPQPPKETPKPES